jgi:AraC-like DNA-binding protein
MGVRSSGEEGAGSTFYFSLPIVQPSGINAQQSEQPHLTQESVLILTYQAGSDQRLQDYLTKRGFDVEVLSLEETPDWLSVVAVSPPSSIVINMRTTSDRAWHILKSLKNHPKTRNLPVLLYSLSETGGTVLEFDYLTKPIELGSLEQALDQKWLGLASKDEITTILIADDDVSTLEMHTRIVQAHSASHRVLKAQNGIETLNMLRREHVDLVLLDLMMPKLNGFGVLEAMRREESMRDIPVIVLTGQVLSESDMGRLNRGVTTVLSKGIFSQEETLAHLETALERNRTLSDEAQRLVRQAMAYIHEHYAEPISRADLAEHVALSEDYLTDCFRKELGVTPITYINRYRVNQAKILLSETFKSITEIALDVGFSDSSYFSRVFRRETGMSPTDYRQG